MYNVKLTLDNKKAIDINVQMKAVGSGSSKEKKALELGVKIMTVEQLETLLII